MIRVDIRDSRPDDTAFIVDSWARSFGRLSSMPSRDMASWVWHRVYRAGLFELLRSARVRVAYHPELPDEILGWICYEPAGEHPMSVHYVFVKRPARRHSVARQLIDDAVSGAADSRPPRATHHTKLSRDLTLLRGKGPDVSPPVSNAHA